MGKRRGNALSGAYAAVRAVVGDFRGGDRYTKLSLVVWGAGYFARGQYVKGVFVTLLEALIIAVYPCFLWRYLAKFPTLGTVQYAATFNMATMKNETNDYDHSFKILLFGVVSFVLLVAALAMAVVNMRASRQAEEKAKKGQLPPTVFYAMPSSDALKGKNLFARAGMRAGVILKNIRAPFQGVAREYMNEKFHVTLLTLPSIGVIVFTVIPLIVIILTGFTNYDKSHMVPKNLFTWVGLENFKTLFTNSVSVTFGYSFIRVLGWTLLWSFLATFTNYYAGILLALFINNKKTVLKKFWRTCFVITIAVPQFVSLMLVRNFFANSGIVNTVCLNLGITDFLKQIGLLEASYNYIPFLSNAVWAKVMIVLINMWVGVPYMMLMSTGILMNIPVDLLESAQIDGANAFQRFRKITMPYIRFVTGAYLVSSIVSNINNFNIIYLLTNDVYTTQNQYLANSNAREVDLLVTWLYRLTQEYNNYKMASVIGIMIFVICAAFTLAAFTRLNRGDREERFQ